MTKIVIDAGGTFVKVAYLTGNEKKYHTFNSEVMSQELTQNTLLSKRGAYQE